ncbi:hypothetical protein [Cellulomonas aerilata]|uniref:Molybdopterin oxidoreductase n=1 Tax=Cellulomonas aerilata TaxID=515326 RepID=A0A512DE69_9CELL|nr:hypothetical protein [Cellulomonas aerilata]GEO34763.1 hypothetical protein CAE01nite_24880 [Cellulomonas aerilata]
MAHPDAHRTQDEPTDRWWVVAAWLSLGLVMVGGLAGAAGLG